MSRDPFFEAMLERRAGVRAAFEDHRLAMYERAAEECRGRMLNARGEARGLDAYDLFMGNEATAHAYASPELVDWWSTHGRPVWRRFAEQFAGEA